MVVGGNSNGTQMKPHCGGPRCQAGEGAVFLGEQELEGLGLVRWGRCRFVFQRENLASGGGGGGGDHHGGACPSWAGGVGLMRWGDRVARQR